MGVGLRYKRDVSEVVGVLGTDHDACEVLGSVRVSQCIKDHVDIVTQ